MIERFFSSQLRVNMFSGVAATVVNLVVLAIAYPAYLYFLGYETYGVWFILATVLTFAQLSNLGIITIFISCLTQLKRKILLPKCVGASKIYGN